MAAGYIQKAGIHTPVEVQGQGCLVEVWPDLCLNYGAAMSARRRCPRCGKEGFVRIERVFKAGKGMSVVVCSTCAQTWEEIDDKPDRDLRRPEPGSR